jgi:hypothetical protein
MASTLAWLDHDTTARERTKRILALFKERGTQDQLGLGSIRDSFADLLFPGTSTIQTRLRYFLFIPWIYSRLEEDEVPSRRIAAMDREMELALLSPLLSAREEGVFGRTAGGDLKRLPSDVYWGGLGSWGIRRFDPSRDQYHRAVDEIYRWRRRVDRPNHETNEHGGLTETWHPGLPPPPETFPDAATLSLTRPEAEFLRDRIVGEHPSSLLAWLALHPMEVDVPFAWEHPLRDMMPAQNLRVPDHASMFSEVMAGAPLLYNIMLSEEADRDDLLATYKRAFAEWAASLRLPELLSWSVSETFAIARSQGGHTVSVQAEEFVRRWVELVREDAAALRRRSESRRLIRNREMLLKGPRSLFRNRRALEERYNGGLGIGQLVYRWPNVQVLMNDLYAGLVRS